MPPDQQLPAGPPAPQPQSYDFIMNPGKPPRQPLFSFLGSGSKLVRIGVIAGAFLLLVIILTVVKNIIAGPPKLDAMIPVAQDQQELIHLTSTNSQLQQNLSTDNQNFAATTNLSVSSAQSQLMAYMASNHFKLKGKILGQRVSSSLDSQLSNAAAAGTFNQTFQEIMKAQINTYMGDLQQAYSQITGPKGRALLVSDYQQAQLMLGLTGAPTSANTN